MNNYSISQFKIALIFVISITILYGCGHPRQTQIRNDLQALRLQAEAGTVKWSDYYLQAYQNILSGPQFNGKGFQLRQLNELIDVAKSYEGGRITKDEFYSRRRSATADWQRERERINAEIDSRPVTPPPNFFPRPTVICDTWGSGSGSTTMCR
jgi:hypothetical protein